MARGDKMFLPSVYNFSLKKVVVVVEGEEVVVKNPFSHPASAICAIWDDTSEMSGSVRHTISALLRGVCDLERGSERLLLSP